ncbi:MAG: ATP-binding protein [Opitutaceae bacterium]|nr:ATP-binding protein [Opitutaceae bacterium]
MISGRIGRPLRQWLRGKSVRHKFGFITFFAVTCAALAASAALLAYRIYEQRGDHAAEALALTRIVAENAAGPVSFQDSAAAAAVLAPLRAKPSIRAAAIDLPSRRNFATYGDLFPAIRPLTEQPSVFDGWLLHTSAAIGAPGARLGTVHLVSDLRPMFWAALRASVVALALALVMALLLSFFVLARLRGVILDPVDNLHAVTRRVTENADFSQRAEVISGDEMGELTQAFNRMLDRLQAKESELRSANQQLIDQFEERKRLEAKLLETSRQAGMAQVATGVLHNVGNVLNSVNISANILRDNLSANPRLKLFKQVADLMREQGDGLNRFLAEDARGRLVPKLVIELADQMLTKQADLQRELEHMVQNVDHIKQIVAMQQNYARAGGVVQTLQPATLFEEATRLAQASVDRHGVRMTPDLSDAPDIESDRHQILQILVNFITNAVQAVKQRPDGDRRVALRLAQKDDRIQFTVEDNGAGIPPENLQKIFMHGFTTRRDGHGFGLHSGALAARNLGGALHVHSDGLGLGARFTLDLPLRMPAALPRAA